MKESWRIEPNWQTEDGRAEYKDEDTATGQEIRLIQVYELICHDCGNRQMFREEWEAKVGKDWHMSSAHRKELP